MSVDDHVVGLAWSPDGTVAAVGAVGGRLLVVARDSGAVLWQRDGHAFGLGSLDWHPRRPWIATGGQDGRVRIWDVTTSEVVCDLDAGAAWVERVCWSGTGAHLAGAAGRGVRLWNEAGELVREWPAHRATVTDVRWQPGRDLLCSTSYGGVTLLDPGGAPPVRVFAWQGSSLVARWSPNGKYIATGEQDASVHFWIVASGKDLQMTGYPCKVRELSWSASSRYLATGGGAEAAVWDCSGRGPANTAPLILPGHERRVSAVEFQHEGPLLATGGEDGRVVMWRPGASQVLRGVAGLSQPVSQLAWAPDDRDLLVGCASGDVVLLRRP
jgi:WD40 repeat protein